MVYNLDLTVIWAFIIAFAVFAYVVMDGFDLGIGVLFPFFTVGGERDQAMNSIAPVWDGNETWLVLGGGGLFAAFPLAYSIILPATYPLMIAMLLGLVFRGVAFEFRWRDPAHRAFWDFAFTAGSVIAAFAQGVTLGALLQGIKVANDAYAGGWLDWLSPFSVLTGVGVVIAYALLGATWLIWKTEGSGQQRAYKLAFSGVRLLAALVRNARRATYRASADPGAGCKLLLFSQPARRCGAAPVSSDPVAVPAGLRRSRDQHVPLCHTRSGDDLGRGGA